jgi:ribosomal protein S18 acetylase RimI-like enzyme
VVRRFRPADKAQFIELAIKRFVEVRAPWLDSERVAEAVRVSLVELLDRQPNEDEAVFVAEVDGNVIGGTSVCKRVHFTGTPQASIDDLFVSADHEHLGAGQALLSAVQAWTKESELPAITVETTAHNTRGRKVYQAFGFHEEDVRLTKLL